MVTLLTGKAIGAQAQAIWAAYKRLIRGSESFPLVELAVEFKTPERTLKDTLQTCQFQSGGFVGDAFHIHRGNVLLTPRLRRALKGDVV